MYVKKCNMQASNVKYPTQKNLFIATDKPQSTNHLFMEQQQPLLLTTQYFLALEQRLEVRNLEVQQLVVLVLLPLFGINLPSTKNTTKNTADQQKQKVGVGRQRIKHKTSDSNFLPHSVIKKTATSYQLLLLDFYSSTSTSYQTRY